jgi:hypothetical protein
LWIGIKDILDIQIIMLGKKELSSGKSASIGYLHDGTKGLTYPQYKKVS